MFRKQRIQNSGSTSYLNIPQSRQSPRGISGVGRLRGIRGKRNKFRKKFLKAKLDFMRHVMRQMGDIITNVTFLEDYFCFSKCQILK